MNCLQVIIAIIAIIAITGALGDAQGPITPDFQTWLNNNGYGSYNFARTDYGTQGSFGGKQAGAMTLNHHPVVFIHGNMDTALKLTTTGTGFTNTINYFLAQGYTSAELYATSWEDANPNFYGTWTHNCNDLVRLRKFLEAVLAYTGADQLSVVSFDMGMTMARKIIKGGSSNTSYGSCSLGMPMHKKVSVFLGISGGSLGYCNCQRNTMKNCNHENGVWPGDNCGPNTQCFNPTELCIEYQYSKFLMDLNQDRTPPGDFTFTVWSAYDNLQLAWGRVTGFIESAMFTKTYPGYTHLQTKDKTADEQYYMVEHKTLPPVELKK